LLPILAIPAGIAAVRAQPGRQIHRLTQVPHSVEYCTWGVKNFLGRKLVGNFLGEVVSDLSSLVCRRVGGSRIKHRVKQNWLKIHDKADWC
jgi:hypothetical protein